ncbi:hypothetical protein E2C01_006543 [Portunus trituberculatus]|uniref:Uncharacterized protein n=1 Tax=Portunus trituberculatus TaxID=210409 RepID=A0A5B7CXM0_PORTR|nr:hypothetical protein [Portunus trituberculatus]
MSPAAPQGLSAPQTHEWPSLAICVLSSVTADQQCCVPASALPAARYSRHSASTASLLPQKLLSSVAPLLWSHAGRCTCYCSSSQNDSENRSHPSNYLSSPLVEVT